MAGALLDSVQLDQGVRLLGVSLSGFGDVHRGIQLSLDLGFDLGSEPAEVEVPIRRSGEGAGGGELGEPSAADRLVQAEEDAERIQESWATVTAAIDAIRARYGGSSVGPASLVGADGLRVRRRGEAQWGPNAPPGPRFDEDRPSAL